MTMILSGDGTITGLVAGGLPNATVTADDLAAGAALNNAPNSVGFRNRIINGDMRISQRGTSFSGLTNGDSQHTVDRWRWAESGTATGVQTVTQDTSAPSGFVNSWKVQTTTAHSPLAATNSYRCVQQIEGNNVSDLAWGAASAQAVTLSFWVRSSLTGVFGGSVNNADGNRFYVFSYTVNAADTWEQKTITIVGDTTGTWGTGTGSGIGLAFSFGTGSSYLTTPGSWGSTRFDAPTGQVNVAGTLNATWYITGVQLEVGSVATPFERRPFGTELSLCQRYFYKTNRSQVLYARSWSSGVGVGLWKHLQVMRATPTVTFTNFGNIDTIADNNAVFFTMSSSATGSERDVNMDITLTSVSAEL